jgi:hypothetical protein
VHPKFLGECHDSQRFNRSIAIFRNALGYRPIVRFFATRSFLSLQSVPIAIVGVQSRRQCRCFAFNYLGGDDG